MGGIEVGYVVSDIVAVGPHRGAYLVHVPKRHGDPTGSDDYNGLGANFGNLDSGSLGLLQQNAEYCYPLYPLTSGGHLPFNPENGLASPTQRNPKITMETVPNASGGQISKVKNLRTAVGNGMTINFRQTNGADSYLQTYLADTNEGTPINIMDSAPTGNYVRISLGTKVGVIGNVIVGQFPPHNNDITTMYEDPTID